MTEYEKGWQDAHKAIADYVEAEVCIVTAEMIRRMKTEHWRVGVKDEKVSTNISANTDSVTGPS